MMFMHVCIVYHITLREYTIIIKLTVFAPAVYFLNPLIPEPGQDILPHPVSAAVATHVSG
jgi:hypothetical protein